MGKNLIGEKIEKKRGNRTRRARGKLRGEKPTQSMMSGKGRGKKKKKKIKGVTSTEKKRRFLHDLSVDPQKGTRGNGELRQVVT